MRWLLIVACAWACAAVALADATLVVELRTKDGSRADGKVALSKPGDSVKRGCTTEAGRCEIKQVPGGLYKVEVTRGDKPASKPKNVMIPPEGEVKLIVAVESPPGS